MWDEAEVNGLVIFLLIVFAIAIIFIARSTYYISYEMAYIDMHEGRIEEYAKTTFPQTWIKYNVDKKKEK